MIFAESHEVASGVELADKAIELFPDPRDLLGQELKVGWDEEAKLDSIAGMFWPAILCDIVTKKYNEAGTSWSGFGGKLTFPADDTGVIVTFIK